MKPPAMLRAVHTTPPMMRAATMPPVPFSPTATMMTEARMSVMSVMPLTGLLPTMAMALAATVVKRKVMMKVMRMATELNSRLPPITPKWKKRKVMTRVSRMLTMTVFMGKSRCVRSSASSCLPPTFCVSEKAPMMTLRLFHIPIIPAMAMPPMPMLLAYLKSCSGEAAAADRTEEPVPTLRSGKRKAMPGTMTHHTSIEPQQMMKAYFSPTM